MKHNSSAGDEDTQHVMSTRASEDGKKIQIIIAMAFIYLRMQRQGRVLSSSVLTLGLALLGRG